MTASQRSTLFNIFVVYALGVLAAMTVSEVVPEVGAVAREFHPHSQAIIGLVISLPSLVVALGALLTGYLVDKFGDKTVLMFGAAIIALGDLAVILAPTLQLILAGRIVSGIGYVLVAVSAITLLVRMTSGKQRTIAMAVWSTFVPTSFIIPFLSAGAVARAGDWRYAFGSHGVASLVFLLLGALLLPKREEGEFHAPRTAGIGLVLRSPWPYILGLSFTGNAFLQAGLSSSLTSYLHHRYGAPEMLVNQFNIGGMVLAILGCMTVGRLLNRGIHQLVIAAMALLLASVPAFALFGLPLGFNGSIACSWVAMFGGGMLAAMWALLPCCTPSPAAMGATSGLVTQFTLFGVLLSGPVYFGAQSAPVPAPMLIAIGIGVMFCMIAIPIWLRSPLPHEISSVGSKPLFGKREATQRVPLGHI